jgi:hypothetical protein
VRPALALGCFLGLLVAGAFLALCCVAVHTWWWGQVLAWVGTLGLAWALPAGWTTRVPYALGWIVVLWRAMTPRHTGAYAVASDTAGYALVAAGLLLILLTSATLPLRRGATTSRRGVTTSPRGVTKS